MTEDKIILDACCGGRMFWFDKKNRHTLYIDQKAKGAYTTGEGKNKRNRECLPDLVMDFRDLKFEANTFNLVVFDPPHLFVGENSYMGKIYGRLDKKTWQEDIKMGFHECFRVLKNNGVLIFKWNESDVPLRDILKLSPYGPLFGHPSGKAQKTHWVCFMKTEQILVKS